jgi:hypothetical protein
MSAITGFTKEDAEAMRNTLVLWREFLYDQMRYAEVIGNPPDDDDPTYVFGSWVHCAVISLDNLVQAFDCPQELMPTAIAPKAFKPLERGEG